jgi:hypothetical protein
MNCEHFRASIERCLREGLGPEAADFEAHARDCASCRQSYEAHREFCCRRFVEELDRFLEQELDPAGRALFELHLRRCPPCGDYLEGYGRTIEIAHLGCGGEAGPDCRELPEDLLRRILGGLGDPA